MWLAHRPEKILISGASGTGKSTYWTRLLLGWRAGTKFIFDHEGEFQRITRATGIQTPPGIALATAGGWCIYDPARFAGSNAAAFRFFADFAFVASENLPGKKLFACDELQNFVGTGRPGDEFLRLVERGRRRALDLAVVTQSPNEISNLLRGQFTEVVAFCHIEQRALEWLSNYGFSATALRGLRPGEFIARRRSSLREQRGRVFLHE